jgi:glycosyltransferase involved in cell wall biosynthesis
LIRFIKAHNIGIVHAHELKVVINALIAGRIANVPVISHTHTPISEWQIPSWKRKLDCIVYSFMVNAFSAKEIALTESRKKAKMAEGIKEEKIAIIPNGINLEKLALTDTTKKAYDQEIRARYSIPTDSHIFGIIGRISAEKGHLILLSAYKKAKDILAVKGIPDKTFLLICGGGALEDSLKDQIISLHLENSATVTGRFPIDDHQKYYSAINSFVFPSLAEGFGIVLIEAMAYSLPVICSDLDVLQEVGGAAARYFETGNSDDLAEKMVDMYVRKDQYNPLGKQGLQRVKELFSMETFVAKYLDLYNAILEI